MGPRSPSPRARVLPLVRFVSKTQSVLSPQGSRVVVRPGLRLAGRGHPSGVGLFSLSHFTELYSRDVCALRGSPPVLASSSQGPSEPGGLPSPRLTPVSCVPSLRHLGRGAPRVRRVLWGSVSSCLQEPARGGGGQGARQAHPGRRPRRRRFLKMQLGTSLSVQWSRLRASIAGGAGSISSRGPTIPHVAWCGQNQCL